MQFGYARVSTAKQVDGYSLDGQVEKLKSAGVDENNIYQDVGSGKNMNRSGFRDLLSRLRGGDELIVVKLDRFGRSYRDLINMVSDFKDDKIILKSLDDGLDTSTQMGEAMLYIAGIFAEMERNLINERTKEGQQKAKDAGVKFGPKFKIDDVLVKKAKRLSKNDELSLKDKLNILEVSKTTYYRMLGM